MQTSLQPYIERTCVLLGPRLALQSGLDPRIGRAAGEWRWVAGWGVLALSLATAGLLPLPETSLLALSAVAVKSAWYWHQVRRVHPDRILSESDLNQWYAQALAAGAPAEAMDRAIALRRKQAVVSATDLAHDCARIAVQEASQARRKAARGDGS